MNKSIYLILCACFVFGGVVYFNASANSDEDQKEHVDAISKATKPRGKSRV